MLRQIATKTSSLEKTIGSVNNETDILLQLLDLAKKIIDYHTQLITYTAPMGILLQE